jgi:hypothetical protein
MEPGTALPAKLEDTTTPRLKASPTPSEPTDKDANLDPILTLIGKKPEKLEPKRAN